MDRCCLLAAVVCSVLLLPAHGRGQDDHRSRAPQQNPLTERSDHDDPVQVLQPQESPQKRLDEAIEVLREMQSDDELRDLLEDSHGVFIVPDYGEAALIIGSGGGAGVLLLRENGNWGNPAFYKASTLSAGLQAGVVAGSLALVLLSEDAAANFNDEHNFGVSLEAGLVVADRAAWARGDVDEDMDVLVWSDTEGLLAEFSVGMNSIVWEPDANQHYYGRRVSPRQVLSGDLVDPNHKELQQALREPE